MRDIQHGSYLSDFMTQYKSVPLDVVSVAEIQEMLG